VPLLVPLPDSYPCLAECQLGFEVENFDPLGMVRNGEGSVDLALTKAVCVPAVVIVTEGPGSELGLARGHFGRGYTNGSSKKGIHLGVS
jgi:hypothetical protein